MVRKAERVWGMGTAWDRLSTPFSTCCPSGQGVLGNSRPPGEIQTTGWYLGPA